jgi:hypothetical protein
MDHLSEVIAKSFPDSAIAQNFKMKKTKCAALTYNVLSKHLQQEMLTQLIKPSLPMSKPKFSLIIDESTDISTCCQMAVIIKYFSVNDEGISTKLLNLIEVKDTTAIGLFNTLKNEIQSMKYRVSCILNAAMGCI